MERLFFRTAGESHGKALIALIEGLPEGVAVDPAFIDGELRRRQGGYGRGGRQKIETDHAEFLSGVRLGKTIGSPIATFVATSSGTNVLTIPVGGAAAFTVASENQSGQSFPSITIKTSTGANPSLPVQITLCQTNPSSGQCMATPGPTVTLAPFAAGATPTFSVFVTATAAIASSPSNEILVLFTNPSGTVLGSASVLVVTN